MANWEETPSEEMSNDNKNRKKADKILTKYFQDRKGRPVNQGLAYRNLVSFPQDTDTTCHWAFYEWINKQIKEGNMKKEPITKTEIIGYNLTYKGDE